MKKVIIVILALVVLIIGTIVIVPLAFKDKIGQTLLNKANENVNAQINYDGYSLSLLKSFPDFTATFNDVSVTGKDAFAGDTLVFLHRFTTTIDLKSLLKKEGIVLKSIGLDKALLNFIVDENGAVNYDLEKPATSKQKTNAPKTQVAEKKDNNQKASKPLSLLLQDIDITGLSVIYTSKQSNYVFSVLDMNGTMSGALEGMNTVLDINLEAPSINYIYDSVAYIDNRQITLKTKLLADLNAWNFTFQEGDTKLNNLPFVVNGGFSMPNDSMIFDVKFEVPDISMNQVLELIPEEFQNSMQGMEASGNINFEGTINGIYYQDIYPQIDVNFNILNGMLKYPDLPDELSINELNANISKPEGPIEGLVVGIKNLDVQLAENPFKMHANFSSIFDDPHLDIAVDGKIDLETLSKVVPVGAIKLRGLMTADASILGNYSALKNNDFETFVSRGSVDLSGFYLQNSAVPQGVHIKHAALVLQNQDVSVKGMQGNIGRSDFSIKGQFNHLITYLFANDVLEGQFDLHSQLIDGNEFLKRIPSGSGRTGKTETPDSSVVSEKPLVFPKNVHLVFGANINHLLFDQMDITQFGGKLELKKQLLTLSGLSMNMLDGTLKLDGTVLADGRPYPDINFKLNVIGFDLPSAYRDLSIIQKYLPLAAKSEGEFSTKLNVKSKLTHELKMILSTITADGSFSTKNVRLNDPRILYGLKSVIQYQKLNDLSIADFSTRYSIDDGNLNLQPFKTKVAGQPVQLGGKYNLGGTLDFRVDATLDKGILSRDIQGIIDYIPGSSGIKKVDVGLDISGDAKKPDVKIDTDKIRQQVLKSVRNSSKEELEDAARKLLQQLFK